MEKGHFPKSQQKHYSGGEKNLFPSFVSIFLSSSGFEDKMMRQAVWTETGRKTVILRKGFFQEL